MKRPLCLFVFLLAVFCFIVQIIQVPLPSGAASVYEGGPPDDTVLRITGRLCKKEKKNGKQIYYLKNIQSNKFSQTLQLNHFSKEQEMGVICYMDASRAEKQASSVAAHPFADDLELPIGTWLCLEGTVANFETAENEGQFDSKTYYNSLGYRFRMFRCHVVEIGKTYDFFDETLVCIKQIVEYIYSEKLKPDNAGILCAMLLGDKTAMDPDIKNLYRKNGIAHVLAISGLHISLLGMMFYKLLRRMGIFPWLCSCIGILLILVYIKLVGFGASSFRASCMFILFLLADLLGRTYDLKTALAFSAFLLLLSDTSIVTQAGFLLSYLAVMGLAWVNPLLQPPGDDAIDGDSSVPKHGSPKYTKFRDVVLGLLIRLAKYIKGGLLSGFSVQVFILPVSLWFYYEFPIGSFLLNLIIIPCMTFILISGIVGALPGCHVFLTVADLLLDFYEWLCRVAERFPGAVAVTGRPALWQMMLYYGLVLIWLFWLSKGNETKIPGIVYRRFRLLRLSLPRFVLPRFVFPLLCMLIFLIPAHDGARIDMLSVGQGDCVCMRDGRGNTVLIDGGSTDVDEVGKYRLLPFLKYHGISKVQMAFISHAHEDHYSAILELLEMSRSEGIKIEVLCLTKLAKGNELYKDIILAVRDAGTKIVYVGAGNQVTCGDMTFDCIYPGDEIASADENDTSMILLARMQGFSMLFTGDSTQNCDDQVIRRLQHMDVSKIHILKTAHHGAQTSTSAALLQAFDFDAALISCGKGNSYGHPHSQLLKRLQAAGCKTFVTPDTGQITLEIEAGSFLRKPAPNIRIRTWRAY